MKRKSKKIYVNLNSNDDACSRYNNAVLSSELGNYLFEQCVDIKENMDIDIIISSEEEMNEVYMHELEKKIKNYFKNSILDSKITLKSIYIKSLLLFILGICLIILSHILDLHHDFIISEVLMIAGWGAIWEFFDNIFFKESKIHKKISISKKIIKSKIEFNK